ncbi:hypothetical protein [Vallitalea okinawensis]|uniref:hypothetical protein n=1 Tax=Vallitalea okinawensis TaxID=2078660 RepID=UPI000CFD822A|nr:hypothetical protein [Vallitalea okinawensis]
MKKILNLFVICLVSLSFVSCTQSDIESSKEDLLIGHISIESHTLYLDEIEWITDEDKDRIEELELSQQNDMPNGYYIHNPSTDTVSFEITDETIYNFIDWGNDFTSQEADRNYSTTNKSDFIKYLNTYSDDAAKVPFWVEVKDGYIISITEQFVN